MVMSGSGKGSLLLLLLLSGLLLWKNVASQTSCPEDSSCWVCCLCLLDNAFNQFQNLRNYSLGLFLEFHNHYFPGPLFIMRNWSKCHTYSISTLAEKNQLLQMQSQDIIKLIISLLQSWNEPLFHFQIEASHLTGFPTALLNKTIHAVTKSSQLQETLKKLASQFVPETTDTVDSAVWTELASLQSTTEKSRWLSFYHMLLCLNKDVYRIHKYFTFLQGQVIYRGSC